MATNTELRVLVLAGGLGTRLAERLEGKPKVLATVSDKPFLYWLLAWLNSTLSPVSFQVSLCAGHLASHVQEYCYKYYPTVDVISEHVPLGTLGAISHALSFTKEEILLILNGDTVFDADLAEAYTFFLNEPQSPLLLVMRQDDSSRYQSYSLDNLTNNLILDHSGKFVSMGAFFISRSQLCQYPSATFPSSVDFDLLSHLAIRPFVLNSSSFFIDIGVPDSYDTAQFAIPAFVKSLPPI